jgi:hypothetical protein
MALNENALSTGAAVIKGALYVANVGPSGSFVPVVSAIGINPDGGGGPAKTVADLKTLLGATTIKNCDYATRATGFPGPGGKVSDFLD